MKKTKRIAFFAYESRELNTYPSITNAAYLLADAGYEVDIYLPAHMYSEVNHNNIKVIIFGKNRYEYITKTAQYIKSHKIQYQWCFAYYFEGLAIASILNLRHFLPTVYFSMELIYENYLKRSLGQFSIRGGNTKLWFLFAFTSIYLNFFGRKFIRFSIIQDEKRGEFLKKEFSFVDKIFYVPNSYIGYTDKISDYAHTKFNIPSNKKILLYAGSLEKGFDCSLFDTANNLPENYMLFCTVYSRDGYIEEIRRKYSKQLQKQIFYINDKNLSDEEYDQLVRSCHIGLAWYSDPGKKDHNMYYLGWASGKMLKYLSCGKPVIVPDCFYDYRKLVEENNLGIVCNKAEDIVQAIEKINSNYAAMQQILSSFYCNQLEFKQSFKPVIQAMREYDKS